MHTPPARAAALSCMLPCLGATLLLAAPAWAKPAAPKSAARHAAAPAAASPALLVVRQYLAARAGG